MTDERPNLGKIHDFARYIRDHHADHSDVSAAQYLHDVTMLLAEVEAWREIGREQLKLEYNLPTDNDGYHYCPWCHWSDEGDLDGHEDDCPFSRVRNLLNR